MRKALIIGLIFALVLAVSPFAIAGPWRICAPKSLEATPVGDSVFFEWLWNCSHTPIKYSIDVELLLSGTGWDDPLADIQLLSFGTFNRTDGYAWNDTFLYVPNRAFIYWDGSNYNYFFGPARARVKALEKGNYQNNNGSKWDYFTVVSGGDASPAP